MTTQPLKHAVVAVACGLLVYCILGAVAPVQAGGLGKAIMGRVLKRDLVRDSATAVRRLSKPRSVHRYTSRTRAEQEAHGGIAAGSHMTSGASPGRPLSRGMAQRRFGLPHPPEVRETVTLPAGHPVRYNKALGGEPGWGEITSPKTLPKESVIRVVPLR